MSLFAQQCEAMMNRLYVPYRDFMEFRVLTQTFNDDMQMLINTKINNEFWNWRR